MNEIETAIVDVKKSYLDEWNELKLEFNDFEYHKIYDWVESKHPNCLAWTDEFIDGKGHKLILPKLGHWSFVWKFGFLAFEAFKKDEGEKAKKCVAMFVYLWLKCNVSVEYAEKCAEAYCKYYVL